MSVMVLSVLISSQAGICTPSLCGHGTCTVDGASYICTCEAVVRDSLQRGFCIELLLRFRLPNYGGHKTLICVLRAMRQYVASMHKICL